jgi:hypothetical protein
MQASSAAEHRLLPAAEPMCEAGSIISAENWQPGRAGLAHKAVHAYDAATRIHNNTTRYSQCMMLARLKFGSTQSDGRIFRSLVAHAVTAGIRPHRAPVCMSDLQQACAFSMVVHDSEYYTGRTVTTMCWIHRPAGSTAPPLLTTLMVAAATL